MAEGTGLENQQTGDRAGVRISPPPPNKKDMRLHIFFIWLRFRAESV